MKKIIGMVLASAMIASTFAIDFAARASVNGSIAGSTEDKKQLLQEWTQNDSAYILKLNDDNVQDDDLLQAKVAGDNFGASFRLYGKVSEGDLKLRKLALWFSPIETLKVTLGNGGYGLYTEKIDYWKVPTAGAYTAYNTYQSNSILDGGIIGAEFTGIEGLWVAGGVGPGAGNPWDTVTGTAVDAATNTYTETEKRVQWGVGAKMTFEDQPYTVGFGYNDKGYGAKKLITVGADYTADNFYGFLQLKLNVNTREVTPGRVDPAFESTSAPDAYTGYALRGWTLDNYFSLNAGSIKAELTAPVTIRLSGYVNDPSYMTARVKVTIPVDSFNFIVVAGSNGAWILSNDFYKMFNCYAHPYASFNVGCCAIELGGEISFVQDGWDHVTVTWGIPFTTKIMF